MPSIFDKSTEDFNKLISDVLNEFKHSFSAIASPTISKQETVTYLYSSIKNRSNDDKFFPFPWRSLFLFIPRMVKMFFNLCFFSIIFRVRSLPKDAIYFKTYVVPRCFDSKNLKDDYFREFTADLSLKENVVVGYTSHNFSLMNRFRLINKKSNHIKDKKFGFFHSQNSFFDEVANELGMIDSNGSYMRHPLAFLVEAADDICYTLIDFEDGINLGWISEEYALEFLIRLVKDSIDTKKYNSLKHKTDRVAYLRALSINTLINDTVKIFLKNEDKILNGEFTKTLLSESVFKAQMEDIIDISVKKVYNSKEVIEKELKGYQVIHKLLSVFIKAAVNNQSDNTTALDDLVLASLPKTYIHKEGNLYNQLLDISCFVASLTDGNALEWYNKIS